MTRETQSLGQRPSGGLLGGLMRAMRVQGWQTPGVRTKRPSGLLKELLRRTEGSAYDRSPCPHVLTVWDEVPDPQRPEDPHRSRTRRTLVPCERPGAHVHEQVDAARVHSGAGQVW